MLLVSSTTVTCLGPPVPLYEKKRLQLIVFISCVYGIYIYICVCIYIYIHIGICIGALDMYTYVCLCIYIYGREGVCRRSRVGPPHGRT